VRPGERIVELAEQARDAARAGDLERLATLRAELTRESAAAQLDGSDVPALRRALEAEDEVAELLLAARSEIARRLTLVTARRGSLVRYGAPAPAGALNRSA
jgi:hypothetical protein